MNNKNALNTKLASFAAFFFLFVSGAPSATAQNQSSAGPRDGWTHLQEIEKKFGPRFTSRLSSGGANVFHAARMLSKPGVRRAAAMPQTRLGMAGAMANSRAKLLAMAPASAAGDTGPNVPVPTNDASFDYTATRFTGFTQSETSSAWCGNNIVVGFNDSSAWVHTTLLHEAQSISLSGVAVSRDRGKSFVGFPFLNPGPALIPGSPFFDTEISGDPVVVCSDPLHFAYSSIMIQIPVDSQGNVIAAFAEMGVNRSSDGGLTWDDPIPVVKKDLNSHFLDKEWLAIDPRNPNNLYLSYTDFQNHGTEPDCVGGTVGIESGPDVSLELVSSKDGGRTWNPPVQFARQCSLDLVQNLTGTQVLVGPQGQIYVAYAAIDGDNAELRFRRSDDGGISFGPEIIVAEATAPSSLGFDHLQGNFRTNQFPSLAVDKSNGPTRGSLYMAWTDASRNNIPDFYSDFLGFGDGYSFGDIVLSMSTDGGSTWSAPIVVSPTPVSFTGAGRDQFMSGVAVDAQGVLAVCYSDRRNDPNNFLVDHYCSISRDRGRSFKDIRETPSSWTPTEFTDGIINPSYMGDYDTVTTDATAAFPGFFNTFQIQTNSNPDVFGVRLKP